MSDNTNLNTFPSNKAEALTMLYLQNQDLSGLTPQELVDKYDECLKTVKRYNRSKNPVQVKTF